MDALLMCGGRGTRLDAVVEKPLFEVGGRPMVDRVRDALAASEVGTVHLVCSPHAPGTSAHLESSLAGHERHLETDGEGYVADLQETLAVVERPVLTVAADLPLLAAQPVDRTLRVFEARDGGSLAVAVPVALKRDLGVSVDTAWSVDGRDVAPAGLNVVGDDERDETHVSDDERLAVNVNRPTDAAVAEAWL